MVGSFSRRWGDDESPNGGGSDGSSSTVDGGEPYHHHHHHEDEVKPKRGLTLRNAKAHHSPDAYPGVRFLVPKAQCHRLNRRGARIDAEACMHAQRGDPTLTLEQLELGFLFPLQSEDSGDSIGWWVQLHSARLMPRGRRARVVLEVMV